MPNRDNKMISKMEFDRAAEQYDSSHSGMYEICRKNYLEIIELIKGTKAKHILDAGCGTGTMIEMLSQIYPQISYTGIDLSEKMIEKAKMKSIPGASFMVGDCENFGFDDNSFDLVICMMSIHHYPHPELFIQSCAKILRKNGLLIIADLTASNFRLWCYQTFHYYQYLNKYKGNGVVKLYSAREFKGLLENNGFTVKEIRYSDKKRLQVIGMVRK